jgi:DNA-directed RNA polymerase specialized sigma24 family protein
MDCTSCSFPPAGEGLALHLRLRTRDATAPADVCQAYFRPLADWLAARYPRADPHLASTAAGDALFSYLQRPESYDPQRGELGAYLRMAARRDLLNLLRQENRHRRGRVPWNVVEDGEEEGNTSGREEEPSANLEHAEEVEADQEFLRRASEGFTEDERRVLDLMLEGVRPNAVFAAALGLAHLAVAEQDQEVQRVKGRIMARLKRRANRHG